MADKMDCFNCMAETAAHTKYERRNTTELYAVITCAVCGWKGRLSK